MKNSTAILATIVLGAALAVGSATASMARGGMGGHGGGGMTSHGASAFSGGHGGGGTPSIMNRGNGSDGGRSVSGNHGFDHGRRSGGFRRHDNANAFFGFGPFCSYGPASGAYGGWYGVHHNCS
ncbi:hypothetical protein LHFGNBLO_002835 [Mesorhizobium sp. AR10]|uniref:hypothetical protein n=1 Tax=Mesorhizobium sp. AR10 TaxID=2865839 RepID=UPI00215EC9C5|nr:hypothetical protein [Mesorhizobium sp. AR10]UVK41256.1 hypothetical protein LHFGNBLO_002835 [Mesorhizobium sp. AR10]